MKIISRPKPKKPKRIKCGCGCVFEYETKDIISDQRDGDFIQCPHCQSSHGVHNMSYHGPG